MSTFLTKHDAREIWLTEESFSDWLFEQENINQLSKHLNLSEFRPLYREEPIGRFRADLYCEEISTGRKVIIENQFGYSDHDHLGKLITYSAGKDADIIIWIVEHACEEHYAAIEWLNSINSKKKFFFVKIEFENSSLIPKFISVDESNVNSRCGKIEFSEMEKARSLFWQQFIEYTKSNLEFYAYYPDMYNARGTYLPHFALYRECKGYSTSFYVLADRNGVFTEIGIEIYIPDDKDLFHKFEKDKERIEEEVGSKLGWYCSDPRPKCSFIRVRKSIEGDVKVEECFDWIVEKAVVMKRAFNKYN